MKYNWDLKQIIKYRNHAKYSLKTTEGLTEEDKALINENIQILNELILCYIFNKNTICEKEFSKFIDQNKILTDRNQIATEQNKILSKQNSILNKQNDILDKTRKNNNLANAIGIVQHHNTNKLLEEEK